MKHTSIVCISQLLAARRPNIMISIYIILLVSFLIAVGKWKCEGPSLPLRATIDRGAGRFRVHHAASIRHLNCWLQESRLKTSNLVTFQWPVIVSWVRAYELPTRSLSAKYIQTILESDGATMLTDVTGAAHLPWESGFLCALLLVSQLCCHLEASLDCRVSTMLCAFSLFDLTKHVWPQSWLIGKAFIAYDVNAEMSP